jgi:hypothetical protein
MKIFNKKNYYILILFILIFFISIFNIVYNNYFPCNLNYSSSAEDVIRLCGQGDYANYMRLAVDYFNQGQATEQNKWVERNWPIGPSVLYLLSIFLVGIKGKVFFLLIVLNSFLWSIVISKTFNYFNYKNIYIKFTSILFLILIFSTYLFNKFFFVFGIIDTGGWATLFFCLGICAIFDVFKNKSFSNIKNIFVCSSFLFLSTIFRLNIDLAIYIAILITFFYLIFDYLFLIISKKKFYPLGKYQNKEILFLLKTFVLCIVLALPLKIYAKSYLNAKSGSPFHIHWIPENTINEMGGKYVRDGGGNMACDLEKILCLKLDKVQKDHEKKLFKETGEKRQYWDLYFGPKFYASLTVQTFFSHPLVWVYNKWFKIAPKWWLNNGIIEKSHEYTQSDYLLDILLFFILIFSLTTCLFLKRMRSLILILIPIIFSYFLVFTFWHFEARYLIPLKGITIIFFLNILNYFYQSKINEKKNL